VSTQTSVSNVPMPGAPDGAVMVGDPPPEGAELIGANGDAIQTAAIASALRFRRTTALSTSAGVPQHLRFRQAQSDVLEPGEVDSIMKRHPGAPKGHPDWHAPAGEVLPGASSPPSSSSMSVENNGEETVTFTDKKLSEVTEEDAERGEMKAGGEEAKAGELNSATLINSTNGTLEGVDERDSEEPSVVRQLAPAEEEDSVGSSVTNGGSDSNDKAEPWECPILFSPAPLHGHGACHPTTTLFFVLFGIVGTIGLFTTLGVYYALHMRTRGERAFTASKASPHMGTI